MPSKVLVTYLTDKFSRPLNDFIFNTGIKLWKNNYEILEYPRVCCLKEGGLIIGRLIDLLPDGSIFISLIRENIDKKNTILYLNYKNKHIIAPDNGLFGYIKGFFDDTPDVYKLKPEFLTTGNNVWQSLILILQAIDSKRIEDIFTLYNDYKLYKIPQPQRQITSFSCKVLFFTPSNSAVINIDRDTFNEKYSKNSNFRIVVKYDKLVIDRIDDFIPENKKMGEPYAFFNEYGYLEVGLFLGDIKTTYGLDENSVVKIEFYEK